MTLTAHWAIFDSNNFNTVPGLDILGVYAHPPKRSVSIAHIARTNKNKANSAWNTERVVEIRVRINMPTRAQLEQSTDTLFGLLQGIEKELWIPQAGGSRKYYATLSDTLDIDRGGANYETTLVFTCSDTFGYDTSYTTIVNMVGITAVSRSDSYNFGGSADLQAPHFELFYTAVSGSGSNSVIIGNSANGQQLTITRNWTAGDRLVIDGIAETVTVNGTEVAYTGALPKFARGAANITYVDNLTSRTFNYFVYYYRRWT